MAPRAIARPRKTIVKPLLDMEQPGPRVAMHMRSGKSHGSALLDGKLPDPRVALAPLTDQKLHSHGDVAVQRTECPNVPTVVKITNQNAVIGRADELHG